MPIQIKITVLHSDSKSINVAFSTTVELSTNVGVLSIGVALFTAVELSTGVSDVIGPTVSYKKREFHMKFIIDRSYSVISVTMWLRPLLKKPD